MECLSLQLITALARGQGRLEAPEAAHLAGCERCRARFAQAHESSDAPTAPNAPARAPAPPATSGPVPSAGAFFGRYVILSELGQGGHGPGLRGV